MRERIGTGELSALLFGFLVGSSLVVPMGSQARQASWLAVLLGGAAGLGVAWIYTALAIRFPNLTLIGYSKRILGKWLGGLVGLLYIWFGLHLGALVLRNFGEFLVATILPTTPFSVPILCLVGLCAYGVRHGPEVLGRAAQVLTGVVVFQVLLVTVLLLNEVQPANLLPLLGDGVTPILKGGFTVLAFPFGEAILFALLLPLAHPTQKIRPAVMLATGSAAIFLAMVHARNVTILSTYVLEGELFPTLGAVRSVDIADFLTRLDAIVVGNWISTGFIKVSVCLFATSHGFAEWAGVKEYRSLVLPMGVIMAALSVIAYANISEMLAFAVTIWPVYAAPFQILMPLLLLGVAAVRGLRTT